MFIQTEDTPNPNTLKFIPGQTLLEKGTLEFKTKKDANSNNLARTLFSDENVESVFIGKDFLTVTKNMKIDWDSIKPAILSKIMEFFSSGEEACLSWRSFRNNHCYNYFFEKRGV